MFAFKGRGLANDIRSRIMMGKVATIPLRQVTFVDLLITWLFIDYLILKLT